MLNLHKLSKIIESIINQIESMGYLQLFMEYP